MRHKNHSIKFTAQSIDSLPYVQSGQKEYYDSSVRADYSQFTYEVLNPKYIESLEQRQQL